MSKKLFAALLALAMLFALCACGQNAPVEAPAPEETKTEAPAETAAPEETAAPAETEAPEEPVFPETLTDEDLTVIEGIPAIRFDGSWKKVDAEDGEDYKLMALYVNQDPDAVHVAFNLCCWEKTGTLMEEAEESRKEDYPKQEDLTLFEDNCWEEEGDFHYVYYCAFNETSFEDYTYCQACFFEVGDTIYELDYFTATEAINFGDTALQFFAPKGTEEWELDDTDIENGCVASRLCTVNYGVCNEFCDFDLYVFDKGEDTIETMTQWFYDNKDNVISAEPYTFTSRLGNEYEGVYVIYEDTYDGVKYYNATALELIGDQFIAVDCCNPLEGMDEYTMVSASAMSYAIIGY